MSTLIPGIHHVTAIAGDPQRNLDFYSQVLGLRLVKLTVNFDSPDTYHLYFGDDRGRPGTIMTFFPWPSAPRGRRGAGMVDTVSFAVPEGSLRYWMAHLQHRGVDVQGPQRRLDEALIRFPDPDGLNLELVSVAGSEAMEGRSTGAVPREHAIRSFFGVTLLEAHREETESFLKNVLGFRETSTDGPRARFSTNGDGAGAFVDILSVPSAGKGSVAAGSVHHVAWRTPDAPDQELWRNSIREKGFSVTPVLDRRYFTSIYFHEPGGVLFEIATDPPGFTADEDEAELGTRLMLPPWLEKHRADIVAALPSLVLPRVERAA